MTVLDAHAHLVPRSLLGEVGKLPPLPGMTDVDVRARWLADTGITKQVLSPWLDVQAGGPDWTARLNDAMVAAASDLGTVTLASVDTADPDRAAEDLVTAAKPAEVAGVIVNTGTAPVENPFAPLWSAAAEHGVPIVLHPPTRPPTPELVGLGNVHGRLIDTTIAVSRLILTGVLDRHPGLKLLVVHGGGFLPYQASRLDGGYRSGESKVVDLELGRPSAYLSRLYYDTVALSPASIRFLAGIAPGHVVLGSDYPFPIGDQQPADTVRAAGLDETETASILHGAAADFFGVTA
ncbi:amidohydrolase family protein [Labedaea rhizosphaerae]|uniref:Aminocarboxymuconate-semialdehyde decarboxylase n=1 Tax=Labedaea rhizosphaerae TaxID=598644 RepID=A0A4V6PVW3_LABRH|nr:amidohydrolase family protein [Labedaea rhizosphaerae]TDQ01521.1 aminocarboxymuconate-semialdehyde decarboxylase [Labedaea rhizosphaerae]